MAGGNEIPRSLDGNNTDIITLSTGEQAQPTQLIYRYWKKEYSVSSSPTQNYILYNMSMKYTKNTEKMKRKVDWEMCHPSTSSTVTLCVH